MDEAQRICQNGHAVTELNSYREPGGKLYCRDCIKAANARQYARGTERWTQLHTQIGAGLTPEEEQRFWSKVQKSADPDGCWVWTGGLDPNGYGEFSLSGRPRKAHRVLFLHTFGPVIPEGEVLDHRCRNRACVRPDHLDVVTQGENTLRGESPQAQNARKTTCPEGHPFDSTGSRGERSCSICTSAYRSRRYFEKAGREPGQIQRERETHCRHGHERTEANTYINTQGKKVCKVCLSIGNKRRYQERTGKQKKWRGL